MLKSKIFVVITALVFVFSLSSVSIANATGSYFQDAKLTQAVKDSLGVSELNENSFKNFTELFGQEYGISSLVGLEKYGTKLDMAFLDENNISNLSPLAGLKNMSFLSLSTNKIKDITPLANLTSLELLILSDNEISDLNALKNLSNTYIALDDNYVSDLSAFKGWKIASLELSGNYISDISPLKDVQEGYINLYNNPLSDLSLDIIKTLESRGVMVIHDGSKFVDRIAGKNRFETAVEISKNGWYEADTVILANGLNFPDALAGGPLAYSLDAPILLTRPDALHDATKNEIKRLGAKNVIILGGTAAVSTKVENTVKSLGNIKVDRIAGADRYETAKKIADRLGSHHEEVIVTYGKNFPDALAIAPYAAMNGIPILLVDKDRVPSATQAVLKNADTTLVIGGPDVINKSIEKYFPNHYRIFGKNRYETAANILEELEMDPYHVAIANGNGFADALTGSVLAANMESPLLLVRTDSVPTATKEIIERYNTISFTIFGGEAVVSEKAIQQLME